MATTIKLKNGSGAPLAGDLVQGEPAFDLTNKRLYTEDSGGTVIEVGTNPSTLTVDTTTLVVDAGNNRVGVGTASPAVKTQIVGSGAIFRISDDVSTSGTIDISASSSEAVINANTYASAVPLVFKNASTERMRIDSSGNVGIGTASPATKLHVTSSGSGLQQWERSANKINFEMSSVASGGYGFYDTVAAQYDAYFKNGNVGIGTASPSSTLHLYGTGTPIRLNVEATTGRVESRLDNTSGAFIFGIDDSGGAGFGSAYSRNIYSNGAYPMLFWTNNAERMRITSSGNVGIGTSSPSTLIEAQSTDARITLTHTGGNSLQLYQQATLSYLMIDDSLSIYTNSAERMKINSSGNVGIGTSSPVSKLHVRDVIRVSTSGTGDTATDGTVLSVGASGEAYLYNYESQPLIFATSNAERMRIDASGNVDIYQGSNLHWRWQPADYIRGAISVDSSSNMTFTTAYSERMRVDGSGNVGIGTTSPSDKLEVSSGAIKVTSSNTTGNFFRAFHSSPSTGGGGGLYMGAISPNNSDIASGGYYYSGGNYIAQHTTASRINLSDNGIIFSYNSGLTAGNTYAATERMRIDSSGNVGIGVTPESWASGFTALQVGGLASFFSQDSAAGAGVQFTQNGYYDGSWKYMITDEASRYFMGDGTHRWFTASSGTADTAISWSEAMRIDSSGNLLVGTSSLLHGSETVAVNIDSSIAIATERDADFYALWFIRSGTNRGSIYVTSTSTTYNTTSDQRLKENIVDASSASDDIDAIQVRSFDWKADGSHQKYGMVAQELVTVAPEAVTQPEDPEEMMGVDYSKLVPMMIKEIQDLRARVAQLEGA